jgi:hypothetical protein
MAKPIPRDTEPGAGGLSTVDGDGSVGDGGVGPRVIVVEAIRLGFT